MFKIKRALIVIAALVAAGAAAAEKGAVATKVATKVATLKDPVQAYWDQENFFMVPRSYGSIEFKADNVDELSAKIQKVMSTQGALLTSVSTSDAGQVQGQTRSLARRSMSFRVAVDHSEAAIGKIQALGTIQSYNFSKPQKGQWNGNGRQDVQERLSALSAEMEQNKEALQGMPIARALYASKIERLKRFLDANNEDDDEMTVSVVVTQAPGK